MKSCICCSELMYYRIWQNFKLPHVGQVIAHAIICRINPSFCRLKGTFTEMFTIYDVIMRCEVVSLLFLTLFPRYQPLNLPALGLLTVFWLQCVDFSCRLRLFVPPPRLFEMKGAKFPVTHTCNEQTRNPEKENSLPLSVSQLFTIINYLFRLNV